MQPPPVTIHVVWKGRRTGPFEEGEIRRQIAEKTISAYHQLLIGGRTTTVKEWLAANPAKPGAALPPPVEPGEASRRAEQAPPRKRSGAPAASSTGRSRVLGGVLIAVLAAGPFLFKYQNRGEVSRAGDTRGDELARTTAAAWAQYREVMRAAPAGVSEDPLQALAGKAAALKGVLALPMDADLRRLIEARARLLAAAGTVIGQALEEQKRINREGALTSVFAGMVAGVLNPDDPVRAGVVAGGVVSAIADEEMQGLARRVQAALVGIAEEEKKLDAIEARLGLMVSQRYR